MFVFNRSQVIFLEETSEENIRANNTARNRISDKESDVNKALPTVDEIIHVNAFGEVNSSGLISYERYELTDQTDIEFNRRFQNAMFRS